MDVVYLTDLDDMTILVWIEETAAMLICADHNVYRDNHNLSDDEQQRIYLRRNSLRQRLEEYKNDWSRRLRFCTVPFNPNTA